ncbi:unnamed protein product [Didymodactylos carnosus]|uniref:peptidylamidoglycolate lyase n=1 Tax=Didymodactylos carnosus TaxID=1234261 RepID=A0A813VL07_9BILA|nr:unnamed protein product [Didymodactylos carnosus]CAF1024815.1 unnamed protein product [Didymodactylos carnosus]CAF3634900.1 unnamed protein product [Didymodactylos carnosus]CAF3793295.1 unnamed protein product [Didymodactylos carnosus]
MALFKIFLCLYLFTNVELRRIYDSEEDLSSEGLNGDDNRFFNDLISRPSYRVIPNDPIALNQIQLGQVSGLAACVKNPKRLIVFQRGSREWTSESFPDGKNFAKDKFGVIKENTVLTINTKNGEIVDTWGNNTFSMPHGLSVDNDGNLWLTDVAMHQVFKYDTSQPRQLVLTLGEAFVPGSDQSHFCKPTDVAVSRDGQFIYVADGYCNERIVKFDSNGKYLTEYKMPANQRQLVIPHSLALIESLDIICVADRENGRIVCFNAGLESQSHEGQVQSIIRHKTIQTVYAIAYDQNNERLYAVSGGNKALGYTFSVDPESFGSLLTTWKPSENFGEPHDVAVSINSLQVFVGEIRPNRIDTFDVIN